MVLEFVGLFSFQLMDDDNVGSLLEWFTARISLGYIPIESHILIGISHHIIPINITGC